MWNDFKYSKKFTRIIIFCFSLILLYFSSVVPFLSDNAYAKSSENELEEEFANNVDNILSGIESDELNDYLNNDFDLEFFKVNSFKELVKNVLSGEYFSEYNSFFDLVMESFRSGLGKILKVFLMFLLIVILFEMFKNFCVDKFSDLKNIVKIIFSVVIMSLLLQIFKSLSVELVCVIEKIFSFSKILFPIILSLILLSGSVGSHSVYNSLFLFLINTGSYVFTYILIPMATAIFVLSLFNLLSSNRRLSKIIDLFKTLFKYVVVIFFSIFGLFSSINLISSGVRDGVSLRLTKFAIKNYIPIIGGYVSQGFDFIHSCSIVIKNAFGVCGIIVLIFIIVKPLILYIVYQFLFKMLSAVSGLIGSDLYSDLFAGVSKALSYFLVVLVGLFFLMFVFLYLLIISITVV